MRNIALFLTYLGTDYHGWQMQKNLATVQETMEKAIAMVVGHSVHVTGCGRTDAGVHAQGQVANFRCNGSMPCGEILAELRKFLPEDIGIHSCKECGERFHARLNAVKKTYLYRIWNSDAPCVFQRKFVTQVPEKLDLAAMTRAARYLEGEHDFSAFCGNPKFKKSTVRTIHSARVYGSAGEVHLEFAGDGFLQHQVRIMAGTLLEVGLGRRDPDSIPMLFGAKRSEAGFLAPAQGLCLQEVFY